jgi:hypothetical protein
MAHAFAINAIGPALLMKHFLPLLPRQGKALCVALHPGTVGTGLSASFAKTGLEVQTPQESARRMLAVIEGLGAADSGGFFNHDGCVLLW